MTCINVDTTPRTTPLLASMRWMVGNDTPDNRASSRWSIPSMARAARIWLEVIMFSVSQ